MQLFSIQLDVAIELNFVVSDELFFRLEKMKEQVASSILIIKLSSVISSKHPSYSCHIDQWQPPLCLFHSFLQNFNKGLKSLRSRGNFSLLSNYIDSSITIVRYVNCRTCQNGLHGSKKTWNKAKQIQGVYYTLLSQSKVLKVTGSGSYNILVTMSVNWQ